MFQPYIVRCQLDSVLADSWVGDRASHVRASLVDDVCDAAGGGNWAAAGGSVDSEARTGQAGDRIRECGADDSEPGAVWAAAACSVAGGERGAAGDSGTDGLRSAAYFAEHLCGHWERRCRAGRRGRGDGDDLVAAVVEGRASDVCQRDSGGTADGYRNLRGGGDDCGGDWRGRFGGVD